VLGERCAHALRERRLEIHRPQTSRGPQEPDYAGDMPALALVLWGAFGLVGFLGRAALQRARTGSWGVRGVSGPPGSVEWIAGVLFLGSLVVTVAGPALEVADAIGPIDALDEPGVHAAGIALFAVGLAATFGAQVAMGASWRIGVEASERTELVSDGPFAIVRNPIYSAMLPAVAGLVLVAPSLPALAGWILLLLALELQVRVVEEPHLLRTHGDVYAGYAARVGRFVPGVGLLRG
jgi:protein-S-isoprenylcysteine O-methyltransferase Ste14